MMALYVLGIRNKIFKNSFKNRVLFKPLNSVFINTLRQTETV